MLQFFYNLYKTDLQQKQIEHGVYTAKLHTVKYLLNATVFLQCNIFHGPVN